MINDLEYFNDHNCRDFPLHAEKILQACGGAKVVSPWRARAKRKAQPVTVADLDRVAVLSALANPLPMPTTTIVQVGKWCRDFDASSSDPLIEDIAGVEIIGSEQIGVLYGPWGSAKTVVKNEFDFAIASGTGIGQLLLETPPIYRAKKGRVLSAIFEDPLDYKHRLQALAQARGVDLDSLDWAIVSADLNITRDKDRAELLKRIRDDAQVNGPPALLDIDTVAAAVRAESVNDDDIVGALFELAEDLRAEFHCTTLFVAHPGKDETKGIAGTYRFETRSDFILRTKVMKDGFRLLKEKDRRGQPRALFDFKLDFPKVAETTSGKPITGAIVGFVTPCEQSSMPQHVAPAKQKAPKQTRVGRAFDQAFADAMVSGIDRQVCGSGPIVRCVQIKAVRAEFRRHYGDDEGAESTDRAFRRFVADKLPELYATETAVDGEWIWLAKPDKPDKPDKCPPCPDVR